MVRIFLGGIYDVFGDPLDGQNAAVLSSPPWVNGTWEPIDSMPYGISAATNQLDNTYTVEVDCWNEYRTPVFPSGTAPPESNWYPPPEGLLEGDSFHTILNNPHSLFGFTGLTLSTNSLGPYSQQEPWQVPNPPLGGETSAIFKLDKRAYIQGQILGFTLYNELRTISWAQLDATTDNYNITQYSWDGYYDGYLDPGNYNITISLPGYNTIQTNASLSPGQASAGYDFTLELNSSQALNYSNPLAITASPPDYEKQLRTLGLLIRKL